MVTPGPDEVYASLCPYPGDLVSENFLVHSANGRTPNIYKSIYVELEECLGPGSLGVSTSPRW